MKIFIQTRSILSIILLLTRIVYSIGGLNECFTPVSGVVYITSYHAKWYNDMLEINARHGLQFNGTILEWFPRGNLIIYHEEDVPPVDGACMIDLREIPWLINELTNKTSGLNEYYNLAEFTDPLWNPKIGDIKIGVSLFFKVVSIYHAVHNSPEGSLVFWVDTDVTFRQELPSSVVNWMARKDLVYIPLIINYHRLTSGMPSNAFDFFDLSEPYGQKEALLQEFWRIESGLFAFTVNAKTKLFTEKAVNMYRGEMFELAKSCFAKDPYCMNNLRVRGNVFFNDIFVYTLLLQSDAHGDDLFHVGLNQGWFAMRGLEPFGKEERVWGRNLYTPNFYPAESEDSIISNFHIGKYLFHHFAYHETGALSMQHRDDNVITKVKRPAWKTVDRTPNQAASLKMFLQPHVPVFGYYIYLPKRTEYEVQKIAYFTICENQRIQDAVFDFSIIYNVSGESLYYTLCPILENDESISNFYKCRSQSLIQSPILGTFFVDFNNYVSHKVIVREGYNESFFASCACAHTSYCSADTFQSISSRARTILSINRLRLPDSDFVDLPVFSFPIFIVQGGSYMLPIFDFRMTLKSQLFSYCAYFNFDESICNEIVSHGQNLFQFLLPSLKAPNLINAENSCEILDDCMADMPIAFQSISFDFPNLLEKKLFSSDILNKFTSLSYFPAWNMLFKKKSHSKGLKILELGSSDGLTTCLFMEYICTDPSCILFSVDAYKRGNKSEDIVDEITLARFLSNTKSYGDRVQLLHMTPKEAFKLPIVNGRLYDIVHIRDEHSITSLLYDIVVSFELIKHGGTLIVGDLRDPLSMSSVIENFGSIFSESIAKIHYIRDQIILIKK